MRPAILICICLAMLLSALPALAVPMADYEEMVTGEAPPGSYLMYRWEEHPDVYVIHFDTYLHQSLALSRLAMWQEMAASRGRIMDNAELEAFFSGRGATMEGLFGAHDYETEDIASFLNALWQSGVQPYDEELELAERLVAEGLLELIPGAAADTPLTASPYSATGDHALVSFATRLELEQSYNGIQGLPQRSYERGALHHELLHGIFFTEEEYARRCTEFWETQLTEDERRAFRTLLASLNYDPSFEELMVNEFQAYLLTPRAPSSGPEILLMQGRRLLQRGYQPEFVSDADKQHFAQHGPELMAGIEDGLTASLQAWLARQRPQT